MSADGATIENIFFSEFATFAAAPSGVQRLWELILQLGMQGRLVPQDPTDEPVNVLLDRIAAEKKRLLKEGKIKKQAPLPPVRENESPYPAPTGWTWVRLDTIGQIVGGGTPKTDRPEFFSENGFPWLTPADLNGLKAKYICRGKRDISEQGLHNSSAQLLPAGTILFSSRAPIGYVAISANEISTNQGFKSCVPYIPEMSEYIYYFLRFAGKIIDENATGTTFKEVSGKEMKKVPLPLPPLPEQRRIVAKLDALMKLCDILEAQQVQQQETRTDLSNAALTALTEAEDVATFNDAWKFITDNFNDIFDSYENVAALRQTVLQLAVKGRLVSQDPADEPASVLLERITIEKKRLMKDGVLGKTKSLPSVREDEIPYPAPEGWVWTKLGSITNFGPKNGYSAVAVDSPSNTKCLTLTATTYGSFNPNYYKYIDENIESDSDLWLEEGDLLIQRGNSLDYVGISAVYSGPSHEFIYPDLMMKIKFPEDVDAHFASMVINSPVSRCYFRQKASGTASSMPKVNQAIVNNLLFPLPPLAEQHRIVAKVDALMALCDELEARIRKRQEVQTKLLESIITELTTQG